ncbi:protein BREVIS RADIX-like [Canna indica]|uniref:Protein BREVIS RADIX-like n=1 Tax=Canna indica TaxID=4628 RepID=A0AAQ3K254_9LILI|nr:protein BREVIS RADIX-like [Canna indica]
MGEEEEGRSRYGGKWIPQEVGDGEDEIVLLEDEGEPREWMAQVELVVHITFSSLPGGAGNDLKRIRLSRCEVYCLLEMRIATKKVKLSKAYLTITFDTYPPAMS